MSTFLTRALRTAGLNGIIRTPGQDKPGVRWVRLPPEVMMLVGSSEQFVRAAFKDEAEIEGVVQTYAEQLFGSSIIYLPQTRITTMGGRGTVPDAVVIDVEAGLWYVVEAERAVHGTWEHIAPQVSRQLAAVGSPQSVESLIQLALAQLHQDADLRTMLRDVGVSELETHGRLQAILRRSPVIAIPIDGIPRDLTEWAQTLRNDVKIWVIEKFVSTTDPTRVLYSIPDENRPTISTAADGTGTLSSVRTSGSQPFLELITAMPELIGTPVYMDYRPRGGTRQTFAGTIRADGIEVEGVVYSVSYAALHWIQKAGSSRKTANGWVMWKTQAGDFLDDLYQRTTVAEPLDADRGPAGDEVAPAA